MPARGSVGPSPVRTPGIAIDARGRAVVAGITVEAHRIAALLDVGMEVDEVVRDDVTLSRAQVLAAKSYSDIHPWTGRPYPLLTAEKAMRDSNSDVLVGSMRRRSRWGACSTRTSSASAAGVIQVETSWMGLDSNLNETSR